MAQLPILNPIPDIACLSRMNTLQVNLFPTLWALMLALPPEIENYILLLSMGNFATLPAEHARRRLYIILVCDRWARIMYSDPSAWQHIFVSLKWARSIRYARFCLGMAKARPLTLMIDAHIVTRLTGAGIEREHDSRLLPFIHSIFSLFDPTFGSIVCFIATSIDAQTSHLIAAYLSQMDCRRLRHLDLSMDTTPLSDTSDGTLVQPKPCSRMPALRCLAFRRSFPPPHYEAECGKLTELSLVFTHNPLRVPWQQVGNLLRSASDITTLKLAGVTCIGFPDGTAAQRTILFRRLTHLEFAFGNTSMVDILSTIVAPLVHQFTLDIYRGAPLTHLLVSCMQLMRVPKTIDVCLYGKIDPVDLSNVLNEMGSVEILDFRRCPTRTLDVVNALLNEMLRLQHVHQIQLGGAVHDLDILNMLHPVDILRLRPDCRIITPTTDEENSPNITRGVRFGMVMRVE
ncbi:hypothetical protein C8R44DRAFT_880936 [Mycena epipterygia]|nr:hypothetical protein C8R44DRAFT_880936 [Mycena epipterygia]